DGSSFPAWYLVDESGTPLPHHQPWPESVPFLLRPIQETFSRCRNVQRRPRDCRWPADTDQQSHTPGQLVHFPEPVRAVGAFAPEAEAQDPQYLKPRPFQLHPFKVITDFLK